MLLCLVPPVNNTSFPFPQQLSQLPQCTENEAGGWGGESYKEIRESLTSLGRSMGCFTRKMEEDLSFIFNLLPHSQRCLTSSVACVDTLSGCPVLLSLLVVYLPGASWHLGFLSASQGRCFFFFTEFHWIFTHIQHVINHVTAWEWHRLVWWKEDCWLFWWFSFTHCLQSYLWGLRQTTQFVSPTGEALVRW